MTSNGPRVLKAKVEYWAVRLKVSPRLVRVQKMTRKWGSCSTNGTITLAADLADQPPRFQDFVVAHELLHLRVPNHGRLFKALMTAHIPNWRALSSDKRGHRIHVQAAITRVVRRPPN
jgi:predicted metal-dependent hydrolase